MPETIASLAVTIGADLTGLSRGLQQAQSKLKSVSTKMSSIGRRLTMTVTAPLVGLGVAVAKTAMKWESAFAGVEKTVDGTTEQLAVLEEQLLRTSRQIPITPGQIARIAELGGQLGVGLKDIDAFSRLIGKLGVATDLGTEKAAMGMARFLNITQQAAPVGATFMEQAESVGATLVDLGNNFAATESEIMEFAMRIAGAGTVVGLSQDEILGWSAALASMGIRAEAGGTAISKVFLEVYSAVQGATGGIVDHSVAIEKSQGKIDKWSKQLHIANLRQTEFTDKTKESTRTAGRFKIEDLTAKIRDETLALEALTSAHGDAQGAGEKLSLLAKVSGVSVEEFGVLMEENASKAMAMFIAGLGEMQESGENVLPILETLGFDSIRTRDMILRLASAPDVLADALDKSSDAFRDSTALNVEAAKRFKTTESMIQLVKNTFHYLGVVLGKQVLPIIVEILGKIGPLVERFADFVKARPDIIKFGLAIAAIAAAIGPLALIAGAVLPLIAALASPLGLALAGVVTLAVAFVKAKGGIVPAIEAIVDKVKTIAKAVMAGDWSAVWEELKGIGASIAELASGWIETAKTLVAGKWAEFKDLLTEKWGTLKDVFTAEGLVPAIETALSFVGIDIDFSELVDEIRPKWNAVAMIFKEKGFVEAVETAFLFAGVVVDFSALGAKVKSAWENIWLGAELDPTETMGGGLRGGGLKDKLEEIGTTLWDVFTEKFPESAAIAEQLFGALTTKAGELIAKLRELITVTGTELPEAMTAGIITTIRDLFNLQMDNAYSRVESLTGILETSKEIFASIGNLMGIVGSNTAAWNEALDKLNEWLPDILDWLTPWDNILDSLKGHLENIAAGLRTIIRLRDEWGEGLDGGGDASRPSSFQRGGVVGRAGLALVGEAGPELVWLPRATQVIPAGETQRMLASQGQPQISLVQHFHGQADAAQVKVAAQEGVMEALRANGMAW